MKQFITTFLIACILPACVHGENSTGRSASSSEQQSELKQFIYNILPLINAADTCHEARKANLKVFMESLKNGKELDANFAQDAQRETEDVQRKLDEAREMASQFQHARDPAVRELASEYVKTNESLAQFLALQCRVLSTPRELIKSPESRELIKELVDQKASAKDCGNRFANDVGNAVVHGLLAEIAAEDPRTEFRQFIYAIVPLHETAMECFFACAEDFDRYAGALREGRMIKDSVQPETLARTKTARDRFLEMRVVAQRFQHSSDPRVAELARTCAKMQEYADEKLACYHGFASNPGEFMSSKRSVSRLKELIELSAKQIGQWQDLRMERMVAEFLPDLDSKTVASKKRPLN